MITCERGLRVADVLEVLMQITALQAAQAARSGDADLAAASLRLTERVVALCVVRGYLRPEDVAGICGGTPTKVVRAS